MINATVIHLENAPPSTNNLYANIPGRGRVKSGRYKVWRSAAAWDVQIAKPQSFACKVVLDLTVARPKGVRADVSNRIKAVEDLLVEMGVLADDSLVEEVRARWGDTKGCRIEIREFDMVVPVEPAQKRERRRGSRAHEGVEA